MKVKSGLISGTEKRESISVKPENCIIKSPQKRESISVKPENCIIKSPQKRESISVKPKDGIVKSSVKRDITSVKTEIGLVNGSKEREIISVKQISSGSSYKIRVKIQDREIIAVVDTAAEVTIMSDRVYKHLVPAKVIKEVTLNTAWREMSMNSVIVGPLSLKIGTQTFPENVYIAPISDDMLLGLDFLKKHCDVIDIRASYVQIGGEKIAMYDTGLDNRVYKVHVKHTTVIPPRSGKWVPCAIEKSEGIFVIEPCELNNALIPCALVENPEFNVLVFNITDKNIKFRHGKCIAEAQSAITLPPVPEQFADRAKVSKVKLQDVSCGGDLPEHVSDLYDRSCKLLDEAQKQQVWHLLNEYSDVFASTDFDLGNFTAIEHSIDTGEAKPVREKMRRTPLAFVKEEEEHLDKMLKAGVIQPSISEWSSAPVLVRKRDRSVRWCVDWRKLNEVTVKDVYPLPLVEDCLDMLADQKWFSKLDANSAYWQVRIKPEDRKKTAFRTKYGLFEFIKMGFGLCNAPATFARVINLVLRGMTWNEVLAFLGDILGMGKTFEDHLMVLKKVFTRFREFQLKLKPRKCELFQNRVSFLGRWVGPSGLELTDEHIKTVQDWPKPTSSKDVERFLGLVNYHRMFIKDYSKKAAPLYKITGKKDYVWGSDQDNAFRDLKWALTNPPILALPNSRDEFILDTDASLTAIGVELIQVQNGHEKVVAYGSYALTKEQSRYCTTRLELLAVVRFTRQYRHYLLGKKFTVRTDHSSLTWLVHFKEPQGQLARWLEELSQYDMVVVHRPGKKHENADALSRLPTEPDCWGYRLGENLEGLPCQGCAYCKKAHQNWGDFANEVDFVIPLASKTCQVNLTIYANQESGDVGHGKNTPRPSEVKSPLDVKVESIANSQKQDSSLTTIREWLESGKFPSEGKLFLSPPKAKYYWLNKDMFKLYKSIIYRANPKRENCQMVIPDSLRKEVMTLCHKIPMSGHQGIDRTLERTKRTFYWHGMTKDIYKFVATCPECNRNKKANKTPRWELTPFHAGFPMERVHLDFLGPLPKTEKGNQFVLMIVDQFTKWVECIPVPSQTAEITAQAAVDHFFSRFGVPFQILTDRGTNFESKLFSQLCSLLQISKTRTTPYRPSANGQVERFNRTLMDAMRCFVGGRHNRWDDFIPQVAGAIRASVNRSTGFTPNKMMLGREVAAPAELVFHTGSEGETSPENYVERLESGLKNAHEAARKTLRSSQNLMKRHYDLRLLKRAYKVGDLVYVLDSARKKGVLSGRAQG